MDLNSYITPIQKLNYTIQNNNIYIKRDDLLPFSFGGNKVRKALLFMEDFFSNGHDYMVTYGSSSSNHCRVIANLAKMYDIPCIIITPLESSYSTINSKYVRLFDAKILKTPISQVKNKINDTVNKLKSMGYKPYFIEGGGHGDLGTKAYVEVFEEILHFEEEIGMSFDSIFLTSGTGTTQAGLIIGNLINNSGKKIIGISNARESSRGTEVILESINSYLKNFLNKGAVEKNVINFIDDYTLEGYGSYNKEIIELCNEIMFKNGVPLDLVYTGKGFYGMREYIKKKAISNENILFIHTGGTPLVFDEMEEL